jgi:hypothetical protein
MASGKIGFMGFRFTSIFTLLLVMTMISSILIILGDPLNFELLTWLGITLFILVVIIIFFYIFRAMSLLKGRKVEKKDHS